MWQVLHYDILTLRPWGRIDDTSGAVGIFIFFKKDALQTESRGVYQEVTKKEQKMRD